MDYFSFLFFRLQRCKYLSFCLSNQIAGSILHSWKETLKVWKVFCFFFFLLLFIIIFETDDYTLLKTKYLQTSTVREMGEIDLKVVYVES